MTPYIPHVPTPKQAAFLWLTCEDAFFGGSAGSGKSDTLLMAALQYVDVPGYAALILRDSYTNLSMPGALIDKADEWLSSTDAKWEDKSKTWRFPSGATLTFGYLSGPRDHLSYKSSEFQFIGVDEASDLRWKQIIYMFSRLRRLGSSDIPLRFRLASNPGGISHDDLKMRYIDDATRAPGAVFIPAKLDDNPHLDRESYVRSLSHLDPVTRMRLLDGDWNVKEAGRIFRREWFQVVDAAPSEGEVVRYWDLAATEKHSDNDPAWTVGVKMLRTKENICYILNVVRERRSPMQVQAIIRQTADIDGPGVMIYMEQEPGSGGVNTIDHYRRNVLAGFSFKGDNPSGSGSKLERANPLSSYAEAGNVMVVNGPWINAYLDEFESFPDGKFKDQVDATSGAFNKLFSPKGEPRVWSV